MSNKGRLLSSALILVVAVLIYGGWLDHSGHRYTEEGLKRSLVTYGIARGLNAVISVAQGTEVSVEPVGVGVTFTPGQILDPINDLVERFSWIVLAGGVSLGAQIILLNMTAWLWFGIAIGLVLLTTLSTIWKVTNLSPSTQHLLYKTAIILTILRLAVPVIAVVNEGVYQAFLQPQYEESKSKLEHTTSLLEASREVAPNYPAQEQGLIEKAKQVFKNASDRMNVERQLEDLKQSASEISQYILNMIVVFLLQTLIFPLLFLWLTYKLVLHIAVQPKLQ